jgi:biopolymer transport protein ExbB
MWTLIFERIYFLSGYSSALTNAYINEWKNKNEPHAPVGAEYRNLYISKFQNDLHKNIALIEVLILICPLLGLLGTVTGMIDVFGAMSAFANGDVKLLATGVSKATLPTMAGMVSAVTGIIMVTLLKNIIEKRQRSFSKELITIANSE